MVTHKDRGWNAYKEDLDFLFKDALKLQLRSDVPNGLFLSSGLDSAALNPKPALSAAGVAGVRSERAAKTWLPALSALYCLDGLIGVVTHVRGVARKPGGFQEPLFNIVMGPPLLAPGSLALVGGMGLAAAALGRER